MPDKSGRARVEKAPASCKLSAVLVRVQLQYNCRSVAHVSSRYTQLDALSVIMGGTMGGNAEQIG